MLRHLYHRIPRPVWLLGLVVVCAIPLGSDGALSFACKQAPDEPETLQEPYPALPRSPLESLKDHDVVFFGEVVVPTKPCSLGYCAGLKVLSRLKGQMEPTVLLRVMRPGEDSCTPDIFRHKGVKWMVFANTGTSKTGFKYLHADYQGPSFASIVAPNFQNLEAEYRMLRARLDDAIEARIGRRSVNR